MRSSTKRALTRRASILLLLSVAATFIPALRAMAASAPYGGQVCIYGPAPCDTSSPQYYTTSSDLAQFTGSVYDASSPQNFSHEWVTVRDRNSMNYLQADGSWSSPYYAFDGTVDQSGTTCNGGVCQYNWSWSLPNNVTLPDGYYTIGAQGDDAGVRESGYPQVDFYVGNPSNTIFTSTIQDCTASGTPPTGCTSNNYKSYSSGSGLAGFKGTATVTEPAGVSPVQIKSVRVVVHDNDRNEWLVPSDGNWSTSFTYGNATLYNGTVNGQTATQPWYFDLPHSLPAGSYTIYAQPIDYQNNAGQTNTKLSIAAGDGTNPSYLTLSFGRSVWMQRDGTCTAATLASGHDSHNNQYGMEDLGQVAAYMKTLGLPGVGNLIYEWTSPATGSRQCATEYDYPTLSDVQTLASDGWSFTSAGMHYQQMYPNVVGGGGSPISYPYTLQGGPDPNTPNVQLQNDYDQSCGAISYWNKVGINVVGMFDYPNDQFHDGQQTGTFEEPYGNKSWTGVEGCYDFGREYSGTLNIRDRQGVTVSRDHGTYNGTTYWYGKTLSYDGGACNQVDPNQPTGINCQNQNLKNGKAIQYQDPTQLEQFVKVQKGIYGILQSYRFVTGAKMDSSDPIQWDCNGSNWKTHWTSDTELYCWSDFQAVLAAIPSYVTVTNPHTVAQQWNTTRP